MQALHFQTEKKNQSSEVKLAGIAIEQEKLQHLNSHLQSEHEACFNINSCLRLMAKFNPSEVAVFFDS